MPSNPIGPGTKNLTVNISAELHASLSQLARRSGKKLGAYVRRVLEEAVEESIVYREVRESRPTSFEKGTLMVAEEAPKKTRRPKSS